MQFNISKIALQFRLLLNILFHLLVFLPGFSFTLASPERKQRLHDLQNVFLFSVNKPLGVSFNRLEDGGRMEFCVLRSGP